MPDSATLRLNNNGKTGMPLTLIEHSAGKVKLYYEEHGNGPQTIVFSHGLLWDGAMFRDQVKHLKDRYRVIIYDHRGQGRSEVTHNGYDMDTLTEDAAALIEKLGAGPCHFAGVSMGGFVALRLALRKPHLLRSCILIDTSADPEPDTNKPKYRKLNLVLRLFGAHSVVGKVMPIMFGQSFLKDPHKAALRTEWAGRLAALKRSIHKSVTAVIERHGVIDEIERITLPTLVMVGDEDVATVPLKAERIQVRIKGSRLVHIPGAGHTSTIENPAAVNAALDDFLKGLA